MALPVISILKALVPLVADAGSIVATMRRNSAAKLEDRIGKLEAETIRTGEVLVGLAEQLQALAEQLRVQAEHTQALARRATIALALSGAALVGSIVALAINSSS